MEYVAVGKISKPFGTEGKLKVIPLAPEEVLLKARRFFLKRKGGSFIPFEVEKVEKKGRLFLIKFRNLKDPESAKRFSGATLFLLREELPPLGKEEFYVYQIVGMKVLTDKGKYLGKVKRIESIGVYDMLILEKENIMIPFVKEIVFEVDTETRTLKVREDLILH